MKTCLICGTEASRNTQTCAKCGEGTWSKVREEKKPDRANVPARDDARKKRSK